MAAIIKQLRVKLDWTVTTAKGLAIGFALS